MSRTPPFLVALALLVIARAPLARRAATAGEASRSSVGSTTNARGGPVFADTTLKRFVGHEAGCDGFFVGTTLLAERIEKVKQTGP